MTLCCAWGWSPRVVTLLLRSYSQFQWKSVFCAGAMRTGPLHPHSVGARQPALLPALPEILHQHQIAALLIDLRV
jgi:hypothetical protein